VTLLAAWPVTGFNGIGRIIESAKFSIARAAAHDAAAHVVAGRNGRHWWLRPGDHDISRWHYAADHTALACGYPQH